MEWERQGPGTTFWAGVLERAEQLGDPRNGEGKLRTKTSSGRSLQHEIQQPSAECSVLCWSCVEYSPIGCGTGYPWQLQAQGLWLPSINCDFIPVAVSFIPLVLY